MSGAIGVGDLVAVVKPTPCCGNPTAVGWHFIVSGFRSNAPGQCMYCGDFQHKMVADGHPECAFNIDRLKRIPPLDELERTKEEKEIDA
jgi:hypothetical protein